MTITVKFIPKWVVAVANYHNVGLGEVDDFLTERDKETVATAQFFASRAFFSAGVDTAIRFAVNPNTSDIGEATVAALGPKYASFNKTPEEVFASLTFSEAKDFDGLYVMFDPSAPSSVDGEMLSLKKQVLKQLYMALVTKCSESRAIKSRVFTQYMNCCTSRS